MRLGALVDEHAITFLSSVPSMWRMALKLGPEARARNPGEGALWLGTAVRAPVAGHPGVDRDDAGPQRVRHHGDRKLGGRDDRPRRHAGGRTGRRAVGRGGQDPQRPGYGGSAAPRDGMRGRRAGPRLAQHARAHEGLPQPRRSDGSSRVPGMVHDRRHRRAGRARAPLSARPERDEINKGGAKIYPADIDAVVERFDGASDVCTFALDDPLYGQNVGMAVVLSDASDSDPRAAQWMKRHLAEPRSLRRWYVVDEIPRTSRGKINRDVVKETCERLTPLDLAAILPRGRVRQADDSACYSGAACRGTPRFLRTIQKPEHPLDGLDDR